MATAVVLAVLAVVFVMRYALSKIESHTAPASPVEQFAPVECSSDMLVTSAERLGEQAGQPMQFTASITNTGERPCHFDATDLRLNITSGDQTVYDTATCQTGIGSKVLLLDTGLTTSQPLQWNGINAGVDCSGTSFAQPGTYVARIFLAGEELLESGMVFELSATPAAKPAPDEAADNQQADDGAEQSEAGQVGEASEDDQAAEEVPNDEGVQSPTELQADDPVEDVEE